MQIDLELYRREVRVSQTPPIDLSVIEIAPDLPERTLVFVHGFGGQASQWIYQLQEFSRQNRVIAIDLRGHGRSDKPGGEYRMPELQSDLLAALQALEVNEPFTLIGHSFGGAIAAQFAADHPDYVERLALIATAGEFRLNPLSRSLLRLPTPLLQALNPYTKRWLKAPPQVLKPLYWNTMARWNGWSLFRSLNLPTLVIRGHLDIVLERPLFEEVARLIPGAEEVDVGYSGHMVMLERRQAVNRALEGFLQSAPRSWREAGKPPARKQPNLERSRPWLAHYEPGVPKTTGIPRVGLPSLLRSARRRFANHTALIFEGARLSYRYLYEECQRFAWALQALGLEKGGRVLLLLPNLPQLVIGFYGTLMAGGVAVFTLPTTSAAELARQVRETGTKILVTYDQAADLAGKIKADSGLEHIILSGISDYLPFYQRWLLRLRRPAAAPTNGGGRLRFRALIRAARRPTANPTINANDLAVIQFTGGTTAEPKGVMLSHYNLVANTLQVRHWMPAAEEGKERFLSALPFTHSYGLTTALNVPVSLGATIILKAQFQAADVLHSIQRYRPTIFPGVPAMYVAINNTPNVRKYGIRSIKACISGSAPLPVEVQEAFERLTRGRLVEGYGLTEAAPVTHANPLNGLRKVGSIGIPLPSTEARLVDLSNGRRPVAAGQIGELAVRGPQVMQGYWNNPEATRQVLLPDGWLLTGDVAQMDSEGYYRIIARKVDMWYPARPGEPAFPRDVEEVLFEIPQVKEAAVVAIAGQPVAFIISGSERPATHSVIGYCKRRLPPELVPKLVIFLDDFPRTFIGKVLRRELARRYAHHKAEADPDEAPVSNLDD